MILFQKSSHLKLGLLLLFLSLININAAIQGKKSPSKATAKATIIQEPDTLHVKISSPYASFNDATGWIKNMEQKWVSAKNKVPHFNPEFEIEYYDEFEVGTENFQKIELQKVSILGKSYDCIRITSIKAYKAEMSDPREKDTFLQSKIFPSIEYYILEPLELQKLRKFNINNKNQFVNLKFIYYGYFGYKSVNQIPDLMKKKIERNITYDYQKDKNTIQYFQFVISPKKLKNGRSATRFYFGNNFGDKSGPEPSADFSVFNRQYYSISASDWNLFVSKVK